MSNHLRPSARDQGETNMPDDTEHEAEARALEDTQPMTASPETLMEVPARALIGDLTELDLHLRSHSDVWKAQQKDALAMHSYAVENYEALVEARKRIEVLERVASAAKEAGAYFRYAPLVNALAALAREAMTPEAPNWMERARTWRTRCMLAEKRLEVAEEMRHTAEVAAGVYKNSDASLRKRLEAAEKDRRWLVDYAYKGPWATINDHKEFDRIAALAGEEKRRLVVERRLVYLEWDGDWDGLEGYVQVMLNQDAAVAQPNDETCSCGHLWTSHNEHGCCWDDDCGCDKPRLAALAGEK